MLENCSPIGDYNETIVINIWNLFTTTLLAAPDTLAPAAGTARISSKVIHNAHVQAASDKLCLSY